MPKAKATPANEWREARRFHAWELREMGWSQQRIAEALGVTQGAVSQWFKRFREGGGKEALRHHPAPGRQAALTDDQFAQIPALKAHGATAFGFPGRPLDRQALYDRFETGFRGVLSSRACPSSAPQALSRMAGLETEVKTSESTALLRSMGQDALHSVSQVVFQIAFGEGR